MREGPPVVYICKSGVVAKSFTDAQELLAFIRWPKSTPTGQKIREWLDQWDEPEIDPQADTKMVT